MDFERCMHQKEGFDAYCIRRKGHEDAKHIHKPWYWFRTKGLI